ncbi:MAG TPA: YtxH domain-containing protein [Ginsengibacter sp.]|nr:YtxH domain-containing protein [Ginsengibacter sp.]
MKIKNATILLLTGVAIGALTGLLLAPDEGSKTRKKWLKKANKYKKNVSDKASEFKDKATELKDNIEGAAQDVKKRFS